MNNRLCITHKHRSTLCQCCQLELVLKDARTPVFSVGLFNPDQDVWKLPMNRLDNENHRTAMSSITVNMKCAHSGRGRRMTKQEQNSFTTCHKYLTSDMLEEKKSESTNHLHSVHFSICKRGACNLGDFSSDKKAARRKPHSLAFIFSI